MDDLVRHALGQLGGVAPGHVAQAHRPEPHETLGEHLAVEAGDLDRIVRWSTPAVGGRTIRRPDPRAVGQKRACVDTCCRSAHDSRSTASGQDHEVVAVDDLVVLP